MKEQSSKIWFNIEKSVDDKIFRKVHRNIWFNIDENIINKVGKTLKSIEKGIMDEIVFNW
jgi:hypothetical protein